jgi:hypothetical protein
MKTITSFRRLLAASLALPLSLFIGTSATAQPSVGVSIDINKPGVYGRIDIGNVPPPVVYAQPIIIAPARVRPAPVYLYVPPGHQKNWGKHCAKYGACGQPVYFVQERWIQERHEHGQRDHGHYDKHDKKEKKEKKHKHGHRDD